MGSVFGVMNGNGVLKMLKSSTFCIHPFTGLVTREDGAIKPCCRSQPIGWIQEESLEDAWNNEKLKTMRYKLLNNERPIECTSCFNLEDQNVVSLRLRHLDESLPNSSIVLFGSELDKINDDYSMPYQFPILEIKLNNLCNLKCRMCNPLDSTSWDDWTEIEKFYIKENNYLPATISKLDLLKPRYMNFFSNSDKWWDSFFKVLPYLKVIEFGGGEPLMDPLHYDILEILLPYADNIELRYATNATKLGISQSNSIFNYWPKFKNVIVNISIDGIFDVYEYIRSNSKFVSIQDNITLIKNISTVSRVVGKFTAQGANILQMAECVDYFINELGIPFYAHRVSYPNVLSAQVLPKELKEVAIIRLYNILEKLPTFKNLKSFEYDAENIIRNNILDTINYLNGVDQSSKFNDFLEFNNKLDFIRNQGPIQKIIPEFLNYV